MMDTYAHAREQFNRTTFDPPTPEIQLAPAEEVQRDPISVIRTIPKREIAGWFLVFGLLAVVAAGFVAVAS